MACVGNSPEQVPNINHEEQSTRKVEENVEGTAARIRRDRTS